MLCDARNPSSRCCPSLVVTAYPKRVMTSTRCRVRARLRLQAILPQQLFHSQIERHLASSSGRQPYPVARLPFALIEYLLHEALRDQIS